MRIFDTHAHISDKRFDEDREALLRSLPNAGVELFCDVACDLRDVSATLAILDSCEFAVGAFGMHPHTAQYMDNAMAYGLRRLLSHEKAVALGEIGLDYYYDLSPREVQKEVFDMQLSIAAELDKPVVLHVRDAMGDSLDILRAHKNELARTGGIMHCFSGSPESAKECLDLNLMIGFGGSLTFKNNRRGVETAAMVPLDRFVFETDCPYLAPVPHRGERNDPSLIPLVANKFAEIRGMTADEAAERAFENGLGVYRMDRA
jgi:TatD DNase family protein